MTSEMETAGLSEFDQRLGEDANLLFDAVRWHEVVGDDMKETLLATAWMTIEAQIAARSKDYSALRAAIGALCNLSRHATFLLGAEVQRECGGPDKIE